MKQTNSDLSTCHPRGVAMQRSVFFTALAVCALATPAQAKQPVAMAFSNTPESHTSVFLKGATPTVIKQVALDLKGPSNVLVQFTSGIAAETSKGCPCSVRAFVAVDRQEARPVKRINVAAPAVQEIDKYEHDRQNLDASTVYELPAGHHTFTLSYQQLTGSSSELEVYYPNLQVIAFPK